MAVAEAHALGIVHRDLEPSNLFIVQRRDGTELVKVLDFGISKLTRPLDGASFALTATAESSVLGTAGSRPFEGDTAVAVAARIAGSPPRSLQDARTAAPRELVAIGECLVKDPSARVADVAALARALAPFAGPRGLAAVAHIAPRPRARFLGAAG